jgi:hypothetical protein
MSKFAFRKRAPKRVLALPDFEHAKMAVLNSIGVRQRSAHLRPRKSRVRHLALFGVPSHL